MRECYAWLSQGDVFVEVPIVRPRHVGDGVTFFPNQGPALLLTYGCVLDKRTHSNPPRPQSSRLQFAPVRSPESANLGAQRMTLLRDGGEISPPEAIYLDLRDAGECVALLSDAFTLPTSYFALEIEDFSGHQGCDETDPFHAIARQHGERAETLTSEELHLMHLKMNVFWTGLWPESEEVSGELQEPQQREEN